MTKVTGKDGFFSRSWNKQNIVLILSMLVLALSYVAAVASPGLRGGWSVRCCGIAFWSVGSALVLVGAAFLFRLRRRWSWITAAFMVSFVSWYSFYETIEIWNYYYSLDKMEALKQAFLPVFRPLSAFLSLYILVVALQNLVRTFNNQSWPGD